MKQNGFHVEVIETDKINVDESSHCLPPHNGAYEEHQVADYVCPDDWSNDGVFIAVKEGDPIWFDFRRNSDECAILCAVQRINPVTGEPANLDGGLSKDPAQNYLRMPEQQWLDGYAKEGKVYQFVVTKAGIGLAVNEFVLPVHMQDSHAIGFAFFGPKNPKPKVKYRLEPSYYSSAIEVASWGWAPSPSGGMSGIMSNDDAIMGSGTNMCSDIGIDSSTVMAGAVSINEEAEVVERVEIETVDILMKQEEDLTSLDKASMGAGGRITQLITVDQNTTDYYHEKRSALLTIYFALPEMFEAIMKKGKRQDASKKDKYLKSGHIGGIAVPLIE